MALLAKHFGLLHRRISPKRLPLANGYCIKNARKADADAEDGNEDAPIKFSTSQAANWKARYSFVGIDEIRPPQYESLIVRASVGALLIYFFVLREENDVDIELGKSLAERFEEGEKNKM